MKNIILNLENKSYPIVFSEDFKILTACFKKYLSNRKIFFISDSNVSKLYIKQLENLCVKENFTVFSYAFKAGEENKNLNTLAKIYNYALSCGIDRQYAVAALGGGVVGDTAGLFASTYMRGLKLIQIPTTLLAMVDSSIGGKTGVNIENGKNIVGTFYQPQFVFINVLFLKTLESKQLRNAMAEIIKYAVSFDEKFFNELNLILNKSIITEKDFKKIIYQCCKFKADIVCKDEKEVTGIRELLNFGHTFGHALETVTKYGKFLHGEAVALGILFAARLSEKIKFCNSQTREKIEKIIFDSGFNMKIDKKINPKKILGLMQNDKKSVSKKIKFVLPKKIGQIFSRIEVDDKIVLSAIKEMLK